MTFTKSFEDLQGWIDNVNKVKDNTVGFPFIILANKVDLAEERKISHEEGNEKVYMTTKGKANGNIAIS